MDSVVFQIGNRRCAVELRHVEEVIPLGPITPAATAPAAVLGAMNVRGEVVAVLDPHRLLGEEPAGRPPVLGLLVRAAGCRVVLGVDRVEEVISLAEPEKELGRAEPMPIDLEGLLRGLLEQTETMAVAWKAPAPGEAAAAELPEEGSQRDDR